MKLSQTKVGEVKKIIKVLEGGVLKHRLFEMGIVPETKIKIIKIAPLGDPYIIEVRSYLLALRKEIIDLIIVED